MLTIWRCSARSLAAHKTHLTRACEHVVFAHTHPVTLAHTPQHKCYLFELVRMTISAAFIETDLIET